MTRTPGLARACRAAPHRLYTLPESQLRLKEWQTTCLLTTEMVQMVNTCFNSFPYTIMLSSYFKIVFTNLLYILLYILLL